MIKLNDIKVSVDYNSQEIKSQIAKKLKCKPDNIKSVDIVRRSIDARYSNVRFSLGVSVLADGYDEKIKNNEELKIFTSGKKLANRPVVVGAGPAGMFASLVLAEAGYSPILIERGQSIEQRKKQVENFQISGKLDIDSNVCFGEGGAGTFSDGKLVTRVNDSMCKYVLDRFVDYGASKDILIDARPHIGTDVLSQILINIREAIINAGGEISFGEKLLDIAMHDGKIKSVITNKRTIDSDNVILATGHGARDVYSMLDNKQIHMVAKGFAVGFRIEHPRQMIDKAIYSEYAGHKRLGAAMYNLKGKFGNRQVYSFCMCPGGEVINASTEQEGICVNGMSYNARDGVNSNAAIVAQVYPSEWGNEPMEGIAYQRNIEQLAYLSAGGGHIAPVQRFADFKKNIISKEFITVTPSIKSGTRMANLRDILNDDICASIAEAIDYFNRIIKGYAMDDAVLTGVESRTSSPVRVVRDEKLQSVSTKGLYPCGEGAGYAGGIMSAAIDGIKCAMAVISSAK